MRAAAGPEGLPGGRRSGSGRSDGRSASLWPGPPARPPRAPGSCRTSPLPSPPAACAPSASGRSAGPRPPASTTWCWRRRRTSDPRIAPHLGALARGRGDVTVVRLASSGLRAQPQRRARAGAGRRRAPRRRRRAPPARRLRRDPPLLPRPPGLEPPRRPVARRRGRAAAAAAFPPPAHAFQRRPRRPASELALRREAVLAAGVRFDEGFGAGAGTANFLGEEYIFIADCLRAGLCGEHRPAAGHGASGAELWRGLGRSRGRPRPRRGHRPRLPPPGAARPPRLRAEERPPLRLGARSVSPSCAADRTASEQDCLGRVSSGFAGRRRPTATFQINRFETWAVSNPPSPR